MEAHARGAVRAFERDGELAGDAGEHVDVGAIEIETWVPDDAIDDLKARLARTR